MKASTGWRAAARSRATAGGRNPACSSPRSSLLSGEFRLRTGRPRTYALAAIGGLLLGFGAMISLGCTVGTMLSGIMAFFREVFQEPSLCAALMQVPPDNHVKGSLKDGVLSLLFRVRFNSRAADPNVVLPVCAEAVLAVGLECFSRIQRARLTRGEIVPFET